MYCQVIPDHMYALLGVIVSCYTDSGVFVRAYQEVSFRNVVTKRKLERWNTSKWLSVHLRKYARHY